MHRENKSLRSVSWALAALGAVILTLCLAFSLTSGVSAKFTPLQTKTHIEIDGLDYGTFDHINDLRDLTSQRQHTDESFTRVSLKRDFVTDPSLYLWAKKASETRASLTDIRLIMKTEEGEEVSRYILKLCKPLSWTVEAAGPAIGGFYEKVDLAVQEIAIF
ncbi:MAG: phage tail protein [Oligoflexales bacterium]|nr:phage tail protein [Oligoflexales bacterium]